jgi:dolichol-phosphate mannosyltransferase
MADSPVPRPRLSVVVPCYDEERALPELHRRVSAACRSVAGNDHEIVLVDDGSRDHTWDVIRELAEHDAAVVGLTLSRNHGHQLALTAGLSFCRGERILIVDADLQDPPELLPDMFRLMDEGADVVYGTRGTRVGETWFKRKTADLFYRLLTHLTEVPIPRDTGDFRLMSRRALDVLQEMPERHRFIRGMVSWIGFRQVPIVYDRSDRIAGTTKYGLAKMLQFAFDGITGFSIRPLRIATWCGGVVAMGALAFLGYALYKYFVFGLVGGYTSIITIALVLGSAQLIFLGLIGEYLGRLFIEAKRRPLFVVRDVVRATTPTVDIARVPTV